MESGWEDNTSGWRKEIRGTERRIARRWIDGDRSLRWTRTIPDRWRGSVEREGFFFWLPLETREGNSIFPTDVLIKRVRFLFSFLSTKIGQPPWRWLDATQQAGNGCLHAETEHSHLCAPNRIELIQELNGGAWPQWLFDWINRGGIRY